MTAVPSAPNEPGAATVEVLAREIEPLWWPVERPVPVDPSTTSVGMARRFLDLSARHFTVDDVDHVLADFADDIHLATSHQVSGVCHGENDGCEGGPTATDLEDADAVWERLIVTSRIPASDLGNVLASAREGYRS